MNSLLAKTFGFSSLASILHPRVKIESEAWIHGYNDVRHLHAYYWLLSPLKQSMYRAAYSDGQRCRIIGYELSTNLAHSHMTRTSSADYTARRGVDG